MLREFAWNVFIKLGILESYSLYKEIEERSRTEEDSKAQTEEVAKKQA
jgi:hypothetical protein